MDLHPIIVHFPVALLTIYALLEILTCSKKLRMLPSFFTLKTFLLVIGFLSSLVAVMSGEHALQISDATINTQIADMHEKFAEATRNIFAVLVLIYVSMYAKYPRIQKIGNFFRTYFFITIIGAVAGLVAVSITGALGGALVYGVEAKDPFIRFVVELLGLN